MLNYSNADKVFRSVSLHQILLADYRAACQQSEFLPCLFSFMFRKHPNTKISEQALTQVSKIVNPCCYLTCLLGVDSSFTSTLQQ